MGLTLYPPSNPAHDAFDENGDIQIKMTAVNNIAMYSTCDRLVVLKVVSTEEAEVVYDGPGNVAWEHAGKMAKNGQRSISLSRLRRLSRGRREVLMARTIRDSKIETRAARKTG